MYIYIVVNRHMDIYVGGFDLSAVAFFPGCELKSAPHSKTY